MGTWSQPNTVKKAKKLAKLMAQPLLQLEATKRLYHLVGNDALFDNIDACQCDPAADIRCEVAEYLKQALNHLELSLEPWDEEAIAICRQLIASYAVVSA